MFMSKLTPPRLQHNHYHRHRLVSWPSWASRWLGYRATPPPKLPKYLVGLWTFIGAFSGVTVIQALFNYSHYFIRRSVPGIIASYGASATLVYGVIESPLAQPRALVGGHFLSALIGVCITKLFETMHDKARLEEIRWLAGSLSASVAIVLMQITETTHPPAGATALLAAVNQPVYELGWYYLPIILLSSTLMLAVALLINNIQRRYPMFWFKPIVEPPAIPEAALGGPEDDNSSNSNNNEGGDRGGDRDGDTSSADDTATSTQAASGRSSASRERAKLGEKESEGEAEGGDNDASGRVKDIPPDRDPSDMV